MAERWQGRVKPKLLVKDILRHDRSDGDTGSAEDGSGTGSPGQPGGDDGEGPSNGAAESDEAGPEGSDEPGDHAAGTEGRGETLAQTGDASALLVGTGVIGAAIAFIAAAIVRRSRTS